MSYGAKGSVSTDEEGLFHVDDMTICQEIQDHPGLNSLRTELRTETVSVFDNEDKLR